MNQKMTMLALSIFVTACSSGGDSGSNAQNTNPTPTPIAQLAFVNDFNGEILTVSGDSSTGNQENYTITSTNTNDTTPNRIERGEVGIIEITECDVFWELLPVIKDVSFLAGANDIILAQHNMQLFSCDQEYTCRVENITDSILGLIGDLNCTANP